MRKAVTYLIALLSLCLLAAAPLSAQSVSFSGTFATQNQSMWGSDPAFMPSTQSTTTILPSTSVSAWAGIGESCGWFNFCTAANGGFSLTSSIGLDLGASVNSGSVNATSPFSGTINYSSVVTPGSGWTPTANWSFGSGTLNTEGPNVRAYADLNVGLWAAAGYQFCAQFGDCPDASRFTLLNDYSTHELFALNRNGDNQLRILDSETNLLDQHTPYVSWDINFPGGASGGGAGVMTADVSTEVVQVGANIPQWLVGWYPLSADLGWASYNLLSLYLDYGLLFNQQFGLDMVGGVRYSIPELGYQADCWAGCEFWIPDSYAGDTLTVNTELLGGGLFTNTSSIQFQDGYDLDLLSASILGISVGPMFSDERSFTPFSALNIFDDSFYLGGFNTIEGPSFTLQVEHQEPVPEPGSLVLFGSGMIGLGFFLRRKFTKDGRL